MKKMLMGLTVFILLVITSQGAVFAVENEFSGNFIVPASQSGYRQEMYEEKVGNKLQRGAENFFLGFLEVPHGIKSEYYYRKQEYLPGGVETFFIGAFKGFVNGVGRTFVGLYEMFSAGYPTEPILPEMKDWLY